uniref:Uncharacterized protein n=1 Tax=Sexangularia sp. CB-2014 TaxID=1486929 RepID=A0A7S1VTH8_9EUKA|mmetsp:Transcript_9890/g.31370  ORF Transcript_9890/g.31370 Transcript_9890/m.31370 type:complete len:282 (+) Transcript_9890:1-846(+)
MLAKPTVIIIEGLAGIGKSTLVAALQQPPPPTPTPSPASPRSRNKETRLPAILGGADVEVLPESFVPLSLSLPALAPPSLGLSLVWSGRWLDAVASFAQRHQRHQPAVLFTDRSPWTSYTHFRQQPTDGTAAASDDVAGVEAEAVRRTVSMALASLRPSVHLVTLYAHCDEVVQQRRLAQRLATAQRTSMAAPVGGVKCESSIRSQLGEADDAYLSLVQQRYNHLWQLGVFSPPGRQQRHASLDDDKLLFSVDVGVDGDEAKVAELGRVLENYWRDAAVPP